MIVSDISDDTQQPARSASSEITESGTTLGEFIVHARSSILACEVFGSRPVR
jgi:hypothetical protein